MAPKPRAQHAALSGGTSGFWKLRCHGRDFLLTVMSRGFLAEYKKLFLPLPTSVDHNTLYAN